RCLSHSSKRAHTAYAEQPHRSRGCGNHYQQRQGRQQQLADNQPTTIQEIAQWHEQQKSHSITHLRDSNHNANRCFGNSEVLRHGSEQRLRVIDVRDGYSTRHRKRYYHQARQRRFGSRSCIQSLAPFTSHFHTWSRWLFGDDYHVVFTCLHLFLPSLFPSSVCSFAMNAHGSYRQGYTSGG